MSMRPCDWCGEPALEDSELCHKCLQAQKQVEAGLLVPSQPSKLPARRYMPVLAAIGTILLLIAKGLAVLVLGAGMVLSGLFGTCALIAVAFTIGSPLNAVAWIIAAAFGFGVAFLLWRLIQQMLQPPLRRINEEQPPSIEKKD